jgi:hypothetical protein
VVGGIVGDVDRHPDQLELATIVLEGTDHRSGGRIGETGL